MREIDDATGRLHLEDEYLSAMHGIESRKYEPYCIRYSHEKARRALVRHRNGFACGELIAPEIEDGASRGEDVSEPDRREARSVLADGRVRGGYEALHHEL